MALTEKQIIADIKNGKISPVYLLMGEEGYYIDVLSDFFENNIVDPSLRDFDQTVLYGPETDMTTIVGAAKRFPMMSPRQLVLVKEAQGLRADRWEPLTAYLESPSPQTVLVFCYRNKKLPKSSVAYKAIAKAGVIYETPRVYEDKVPAWIVREVSQRGHTISDKAAALLAESLGTELSKIANELDKILSLLPQGGAVTEQLVEEQVGISKDFNIFELQNAIGRRDPVMCNRIVNYFIESPKQHPIAPLLSTLYSYFIKVMIYHQVENKSDAASALGISPYFLSDYALAARNYPLGKLATCIGYLHECDLRSKGVRNSGAVTEGQLLKELVFKIIH